MPVRIASVQCDVALGDWKSNLEFAREQLQELAGLRVELAIFPECSLTGYCVDSPEECTAICLNDSDRAAVFAELQSTVDTANIAGIIGYANLENGKRYNAATIFAPGDSPKTYRKTHLPYLGFDRFATAGDQLEIFEFRGVRIGVMICFDMRPPECARTLALRGADLLAIPTNWPEGAENSAEHGVFVRAAENKVFVASANRVGTENGVRFIGLSKIVGPSGQLLCAAEDTAVTLIHDIDPEIARQKRTVIRKGEYEYETLGARRPELYNPQ